MDAAHIINLNGTDYEVEDKSARSSQTGLDSRVDSLGTVIEEQVEPLAEQVDALASEVATQGTRITALENASSGLRFEKIHSGITGKNGTSLKITGASAKTIGLIIRTVNNATGLAQDTLIFLRRSTAAFTTDSAYITNAGRTSGDTGNFVFMFRQCELKSGGTNFANWVFNVTYGGTQNFNSTSYTMNDNVMIVTDVWRVDQGD